MNTFLKYAQLAMLVLAVTAFISFLYTPRAAMYDATSYIAMACLGALVILSAWGAWLVFKISKK